MLETFVQNRLYVSIADRQRDNAVESLVLGRKHGGSCVCEQLLAVPQQLPFASLIGGEIASVSVEDRKYEKGLVVNATQSQNLFRDSLWSCAPLGYERIHLALELLPKPAEE